MKKIYGFMLIVLAGLSLIGCSSDITFENSDSKYDIIIGDKTKELVEVTFITLNYDGVRERFWGVEKGTALSFNHEPKYPHRLITIASYGLSPDFTPENGSINFNTYVFNEDTTVYVRYYGGFMLTRFCIPNGPTDKGSGMMFEQRLFFDNTEIYSLPTLEDQFFDTDWGKSKLAQDLTPWVAQWGYTRIVGWYYDEDLTQEVTVPFKVSSGNSNICLWVKGE